MKLALAHYSSPTDISGVTTWFQKLAVRLHSDGVNLAVYLHHFGENPNEASILPFLKDGGVPVEVVARRGSLRADILQTLGFLDRYRPTLFLPQCLNAHYFAAAIAGKQGVPWALTMHSDDPDYWAIAEARPPESFGGKLVCVSEHIADLATRRRFALDPIVIPYGVEIPDRKAAVNCRSFRVAYCGRLVETQKRMSLVMATLIEACRSCSRIVATVIGDGPSLTSCQQAVAMAGLAQRITFTGRLGPQEVKNELLTSQAILLMSDFEGLPVALLEAMAVGVVPVVRAIASGIPELVLHERTGLLVDDQPVNAASALVRLAGDSRLWECCSQAGRALVLQRYSEEACYQRWLSVVHELDGRSTARYPLRIPWRLAVPEGDRRFTAGYPPYRPPWLRVAVRLKNRLRMAARVVLRK